MARRKMMYLEFANREALSDYLKEKREGMYEMIWTSIDVAFNLGTNSAEIVEIYLEEEQTYINMASHEEDWLHSLGLSLEYYVSVEKYETCSKIKSLISQIEHFFDTRKSENPWDSIADT